MSMVMVAVVMLVLMPMFVFMFVVLEVLAMPTRRHPMTVAGRCGVVHHGRCSMVVMVHVCRWCWSHIHGRPRHMNAHRDAHIASLRAARSHYRQQAQESPAALAPSAYRCQCERHAP